MSLPIAGQPTPVPPEHVEAKIKESLPDATVVVEDLTGTKDHYKVVVTSSAFEGKSLLERHQLIYTALAEEMKGPIHALTIDAKTPEA